MLSLGALLVLLCGPGTVLGQTPLVCGQTLTNMLSVPTQLDLYGYSSTPGQVTRFAFWGPVNCYSAGSELVADIYSPGGELLARLGGGCTMHATNLTVAFEGAYSIQVHDRDYAHTGNYALSVQTVTAGGCASTPIACGQTVTNRLSLSSEMDAWSYVGSAGDTVRFAFWGPVNCYAGGSELIADVYDPSGQLLATLGGGCTTHATNLTLAVSGAYTVLAHDRDYANLGNYAVSVQSVAGGGCAGTAIECGQTVTNRLNLPSQMDACAYLVSAGQTLRFAFWGPVNCYSAGSELVADVYDPGGQRLATLGGGCTTHATNLTLAVSGAFTVLVHDRDYANVGNYAVSIQSVAGGGCADTAIACGQTVTNRLSLSSQMDACTYLGTAGQTLRFAFWGPVNCYSAGSELVADVYDPSGQLLATLGGGCTTHAADLTLAMSGAYTVLVHDRDYANAGNYAVSIDSASGGGCDGRLLDCGQTLNGQLSLPSQIDSYALAVNAGQRVVLSVGGFGGMVVDLFDPGASNVVSFGPSGATNLTLASTGVYTLLVHAGNYTTTGGYSLGLTVLGGCSQLHLGSTVVRTQQVACLPLDLFASSPAVAMSFTLQAPIGYLANATLNASEQFTNAIITPGPNSRWVVNLQANPTNPVSGEQIIGAVCFTAVATQSVFVPVLMRDFVVTNQGGFVASSSASGGRVVIIAEQSLLEASLGTNNQRLLTLYGKATTDYELRYTSDIRTAPPWALGWATTLPASMFDTWPLPGPLSNAPSLFFRANEK